VTCDLQRKCSCREERGIWSHLRKSSSKIYRVGICIIDLISNNSVFLLKTYSDLVNKNDGLYHTEEFKKTTSATIHPHGGNENHILQI
jgi:hypothetical protein